MAKQEGVERLVVLQRRWKAEGFAYCLLLSLAIGLVGMLLSGWNWVIGVGGLVIGLVVLLWRVPYWRITMTDIVRYLDRQLPGLEESSGLLLKSGEELGPLERLQAVRMVDRMGRMQMPKPLRKKLWIAEGVFLFVVILCIGAGKEGKRMVDSDNEKVVVTKVSPGVQGVTITIAPPAYTGRVKRTQGSFSLRVEEGAFLRWEIRTSGAMDTVSFLFNDTSKILLRRVDSSRTVWEYSVLAAHPGFYQVRAGGRVSELYKLEVIKDEPPAISVRSPQGHTVLDYGESTKVPMRVELRDDYGIGDASVMATVSSGRGEAVKFKTQELRWSNGFGGMKYDLSKVLDLSAMELKPGDELYFYCRAKDNHGQESRSDMYIITLADTAQLMSLEGLTLPSNVKPEFFRSERQIIIETEQLLKSRDTMSVADFNAKSNDLGIDQKLLRLRYGKFLGEEAEEGDVKEPDTKPGAFGDAAKILDAYTDKHDNAEDATFFEPAIKAQLKATLSEMWKAELQLRTYKPADALPFEYKALRLLKDLQQQSRSFVAKTGVKVTPLNPGKRLTGELKGVEAPVQKAIKEAGLSEEDVLRMVLGILEQRISGREGLMEEAMRSLGKAAASRPGEFLDGYRELRKVVEGKDADIRVVQEAIGRLLPVARAVPSGRVSAPDAGLSGLYFKHL
ncbi:MAG: DUF4175 family protein [Bacteroidetes bacterium]|nr:DUF4175 family protein [Bacteroidota bacterium]